ncbi:hypothetical protein RF007C_13770 [Ruminococcus flavefaciens 007c]|uniref:Uncharacterized protein n=1 Tax=Ruminococcus flavefaciens 007c TaxID=1341157 RepID=W7UEN7_RUMFL|nr:hypothetical protein RF007C_13770 [Ruminococcus flavefaciens 007c]
MSYTITDSKKLSSVFSEAASGIINYDRVSSYKKIIDIKVLASENEEPVTSGYNVLFQASPTTGDNNCNTIFVAIMLLGIITAAIAFRTKKRIMIQKYPRHRRGYFLSVIKRQSIMPSY